MAKKISTHYSGDAAKKKIVGPKLADDSGTEKKVSSGRNRYQSDASAQGKEQSGKKFITKKAAYGPAGRTSGKPRTSDGERRIFNKRTESDGKPFDAKKPGKAFTARPGKTYGAGDSGEKRTPGKRQSAPTYKHHAEPRSYEEKPKRKPAGPKLTGEGNEHEFFASKSMGQLKTPKKVSAEPVADMPLNKFIAHCGICSRRDAVDLIKKGKVKFNGAVEVNPAVKVSEADTVFYEEKRVIPQRKLVYYLLNKPKDYITTTEDPEGRKTVLDLFRGVADARIFPVGRLDRNTTGLLLLTNDGELAQKLSHPKHRTIKVYQVGLDKPLLKKDFDAIAKGLTLEDGLAQVDEVAYTNPKDKTEIGIQIHIGRNRIVRRIFEHLQYQVKTLDRVVYAGLTKKNLPRGKWRELTPKEVIFLKHFK